MSHIKVEYIDHCGSDLSVANAARVSFDKESDWEYDLCDCDLDAKDNCEMCDCPLGRSLSNADAKLINYLAKHKHFSPFNHSFISVRVKAPVFVARQLVKHKFMPWNEVSRRYVKDEPEFYDMTVWREAAQNVKQGSGEEFQGYVCTEEECGVDYAPADIYEKLNYRALEDYNLLVDAGVCAEQARALLPQSMMTTWIWSGTLGAFCDMLKLRLDSHTQLETRLVAQQVAEIVKELFPVSYEALVGEVK